MYTTLRLESCRRSFHDMTWFILDLGTHTTGRVLRYFESVFVANIFLFVAEINSIFLFVASCQMWQSTGGNDGFFWLRRLFASCGQKHCKCCELRPNSYLLRVAGYLNTCQHYCKCILRGIMSASNLEINSHLNGFINCLGQWNKGDLPANKKYLYHILFISHICSAKIYWKKYDCDIYMIFLCWWQCAKGLSILRFFTKIMPPDRWTQAPTLSLAQC